MADDKYTADGELLARQFELHRSHLRSVAYRMLGSSSDADDALQETWLRLSRSDTDDVVNLAGWLTTVVSRVCLDMLRSRGSRREIALDEHEHPDLHDDDRGTAPESQAVLADSVGVAMLVVLDTLDPAERLAFVLHDMFAVPFDEIAPIVDRTPAAARQLASRARRRVRGASATEPADQQRRNQVVDAFLAASREGRFGDLLALLDPAVVLRADDVAVATAKAAVGSGAPALESELRGPRAVAGAFSGKARHARPVLIDGMPGAAWAPGGTPRSVFVFTVEDGMVTEIEVIVDPATLEGLDVVFVD
ncbi:sigma-70 family RNA polymerase sigma factor [Rhodococcus chondri]|uniref:Sigma-70 family RNA polymerase sigma factor n=1 Tax=Rhodococcus chondri TaxID=3065941 RepID=A0ABU7JZ94_9NOCA|nr:sigma-70 family RNA polymerase sigma factor [Rhodococcus sp. CC-R104]MEE2035333.1 sigma-70 family RNA polymerase sigma factor [Rhodococcus sp. CC-R104]